MNSKPKFYVYLMLFLPFCILTACDEGGMMAPVVEANWRETNPHITQHVVQKDETIFSIAFRYDLDYRELAAINGISEPYVLTVGQTLQLKQQALQVVPQNFPSQRQVVQRVPIKPKPIVNQPLDQFAKHTWTWPARGPILAGFSPAMNRKGIDIAGKKGQMIRAAASGTVAYAGDGLPGYGNLILIKHNNQILTAYAYNAHNKVHEGQTVQAGQPIAEMGKNPQHRYAVHFEVRKSGQPVNPRRFLRG